MIAADARENQIFLHIFTRPCFRQNQNVLILIPVPAFFLITYHDTSLDGDHPFSHHIYDLAAVGHHHHRGPLTVDLLQKAHDLHGVMGVQVSRRLVGYPAG